MSATERALRDAALVEFGDWLEGHGQDRDLPLRAEVEDVDKAFEDYGQALFRQGAAVGAYKRVLLAAQDRRKVLKRRLAAAWDVATNWEHEEPGGHHVPVPRLAYAAALTLTCLWAAGPPERRGLWREVLRALVVGWVALARPGELLRLTRRDVVLPSDLGEAEAIAFVIFTKPKGRWSRRAPLSEHVRVDDDAAVRFLEQDIGHIGDSELLFPGLAVGDRYRKAWDAVFGVTGNGLGFQTRDGIGLTPASLRAGAGCELYARTADPTRFSWLARHQNPDTARCYLQESAAAMVLGRLPRHERQRIRDLARAAPGLLERFFVR